VVSSASVGQLVGCLPVAPVTTVKHSHGGHCLLVLSRTFR
jgi:hypothetical protein